MLHGLLGVAQLSPQLHRQLLSLMQSRFASHWRSQHLCTLRAALSAALEERRERKVGMPGAQRADRARSRSCACPRALRTLQHVQQDPCAALIGAVERALSADSLDLVRATELLRGVRTAFASSAVARRRAAKAASGVGAGATAAAAAPVAGATGARGALGASEEVRCAG